MSPDSQENSREDIASADQILLGCAVQDIVLPERISQGALRWAELSPQQPALVSNESTLTYLQLQQAVVETIEILEQTGVRPGDRVMLLSENGISLVVLLLALSEMDAIAVVINARLTEREIDAIEEDCSPRLTICTTADSVNATNYAITHHFTVVSLSYAAWSCSEVKQSTAFPVAGPGVDQIAAMIYTTGTTGSPKGVMLTHQNLSFIATVSGKLRGIRATDTVYCVLPMSHVFGLSAVCCSVLFSGGCARLVARFDANEALRAFASDGVVGFLGVPTMYALMLEVPLENDWHAEHLRFLYSGGAPLDMNLKQRVQERFGLPLHNGYGLTETGPTISQTRLYAPLDNCSVGCPLPGVTIDVRDQQGQSVAQGEVGELWVQGPNVMKGYFGKPELTDQVLIDGWFNTGDMVLVDEQGSIHISGRSKELIIRSGFNVYPPEVEAVLNTHPSVAISAVVGKQVSGNEEIIAFVQPVQGQHIELAELFSYAHAQLAGYKVPSEIRRMDALPAAASGKILKHQLLAMI